MTNERREAFFGLIAPIGVDLDAVANALSQALTTINYKMNEIRLTDIFRENSHWYDVNYKTEEEKYIKFIKAGDELCKDAHRKDIMALYGIARLRKYSARDDSSELPKNVIHVFRQIKRTDEINLLDSVFGRNILYISCYSPNPSYS